MVNQLKDLLAKVKEVICFDHPSLMAKIEFGKVIVSGTYVIMPTTDEFIGQGSIAEYEVEINFPATFPWDAPIVYETGDTIEKTSDNHFFTDGDCCIVIWETWVLLGNKVSVQDYFDIPFKNYFLGQHQKKQNGEWVFGEEAHNKEGLIDNFSGLLSCKPKEEQITYLLELLSKDCKHCPCESKKRVREYCAISLFELRNKVRPQDAKRMLDKLKKFNDK